MKEDIDLLIHELDRYADMIEKHIPMVKEILDTWPTIGNNITRWLKMIDLIKEVIEYVLENADDMPGHGDQVVQWALLLEIARIHAELGEDELRTKFG